jgi:hypothetical protein
MSPQCSKVRQLKRLVLVGGYLVMRTTLLSSQPGDLCAGLRFGYITRPADRPYRPASSNVPSTRSIMRFPL